MTREVIDSICPAEVLEAIPWYPDGLGDAQRGLVEAHAAACDECRRELLMIQGEPTVELPEAPGADRVWAAVLERVAAEGAEAPVRVAPAIAPRRPATRSWVRAASRPLPIAASIALAVAFGALGTIAGSRLGDDVYTPATAQRGEVLEAGPALDVVFRKSASAEEIESALRGVGGSVVAGPSGLGVYRIALRPGVDARGAAFALRGDEGGVASLAEPALP
jgi:anti-sigma factor RsiW